MFNYKYNESEICMKTIAMYLPQFHRVKENDEWWGEGFTEWTAVKSAEKLFDSHEQPRVPLDNMYYDLLDKNTMSRQSELMHKYQIDGMCFYHYYFKDGKKILEKPAENLLKWQDIDMPFCFSWANESWVRSWSNIAKSNSWFAIFDDKKSCNSGDIGILLEQDYGDRHAWEEHYRYLSPFFHNTRYIKYENMPVFMIYKPENIPCLMPMLEYWDDLAKAEGFPGIYTIGTNIQENQKRGLKAINIQEPQNTIDRFYGGVVNSNQQVRLLIDYQDIWDKLLCKETPDGASLGGFVGYDDTPRHGRRGSIVHQRNPYLFYEGMKGLLVKAARRHSPFVFINAWNEWGEGMYLEPDAQYGFAFLEAFRQAKRDYLRMSEDNVLQAVDRKLSIMQTEYQNLEKKVNRYRGYWQVFDAWLKRLENGDSPLEYLKAHGYNSIAIYGYGMLGKHLIYQLQKENYDIKYAIDKNKSQGDATIELYNVKDELPQVDVIVVTALYDYDRIYCYLKKRVTADIVPIDRLLER